MRSIGRVRSLALLVAVMALAGCAGGSATPTPAPTPSPVALSLETSEFAFTPSSLTIKAGVDTPIRLVNTGVVEHDLTIEALSVKIPVKVGGTADSVIVAPKAGTYDFHCSIPGHKEAGMVGTLVVE